MIDKIGVIARGSSCVMRCEDGGRIRALFETGFGLWVTIFEGLESAAIKMTADEAGRFAAVLAEAAASAKREARAK